MKGQKFERKRKTDCDRDRQATYMHTGRKINRQRERQNASQTLFTEGHVTEASASQCAARSRPSGCVDNSGRTVMV